MPPSSVTETLHPGSLGPKNFRRKDSRVFLISSCDDENVARNQSITRKQIYEKQTNAGIQQRPERFLAIVYSSTPESSDRLFKGEEAPSRRALTRHFRDRDLEPQPGQPARPRRPTWLRTRLL